MIIEVDETGTIDGIASAIDRATSTTGVTSLVVLTCAENGFRPEQLDPVLQAARLPLMGGVFPAIMSNERRFDCGSIVWGVRSPLSLSVLEGLSDSSVDMVDELESHLPEITSERSLQIVFVDGLASRIGAFTDALHELTGLNANTLGGGTGSLDFVRRPSVLSNTGMLEDAAVIATVPGEAGLGVAHGWTKIKGPYRVTEAQQNTIISLDWRPAFDVYREAVEAHSGRRFAQEEFFDLAKAYPFGIARLEAESIVRDPLKCDENGALVCVGEVPQGEHVDILNGDAQALVTAAISARTKADERLNHNIKVRLCMDCISRVLFLGDDFQREISGVFAGDDVPLLGACTLGEIANHGGEFVEFYNKTTVVAALPTDDLS